jgi:hypothetical protein
MRPGNDKPAVKYSKQNLCRQMIEDGPFRGAERLLALSADVAFLLHRVNADVAFALLAFCYTEVGTKYTLRVRGFFSLIGKPGDRLAMNPFLSTSHHSITL